MIAKILKIKHCGTCHYIQVKAPGIARQARPGQFVQVKAEGENAPFWRRPFSLCRVQGNTIALLIKTIGRGTELITRKRAGESLDMVGPLGTGFTLSGTGPKILVAGGSGVAPLLFLAETLRRTGRPVEVIIGGQCQEDILLRRELQRSTTTVACTTEDGSLGKKGLATEYLQARLQKRTDSLTVAAAGPYAMLRAVAKLARAYSVPAEVSLEEVMACGLGVCNGCVVKISGRYQRVCKEGPVFSAQDIEWEVMSKARISKS